MPKANMLDKTVAKVWSTYSDDVGKALIHMGAIGWFLSSAAQLGMIATNKDIDKKEKKFLIPQEIADGVINVGLYYTICQSIKSIGDKLAENCRYVTQTTFDTITNINRKETSGVSNYVEGMVNEFRRLKIVDSPKKNNLTDFYNGAIKYLKNPEKYFKKKVNIAFLEPESICIDRAFSRFNTPELRAKQIEVLENAQRNFNKYKNGIGVITSVGASILACNLITPVARNLTANHYQRKLMKNNYKRVQTQEPLPQKQVFNPISGSQTFNMFKI